MEFEKRVYEQEFRLNDTDDSIVEYIQKNRNKLHTVSIHKIAEELFVSPNAIMRLAKKLGYSGFSELKFSLQKEDEPEDIRTVENRVLDRLPQNIVKTLDVLDEDRLQDLVEQLLESRQVLFAGIGDSVYFCELFGRYLRCLGKRVEYFQQIHDIEFAARHYEEGDFIVVISASGKPQRLVNLAAQAKERNVGLFAITSYGSNPLSEVCEKQLCFWGEPRNVNGYNVTDRSGLQVAIRLVCEEFWKKFCV